jgi:excisionase family DNA binding protein
MSSTTDVFESLIERAVEAGVRKALNVNEATNRRLFSIEEATVYLALSRREIYNMIASDELPAVKHGRRTLLDIQNLNEWIEQAKKGSR